LTWMSVASRMLPLPVDNFTASSRNAFTNLVNRSNYSSSPFAR